eukprot:365676-Chlamydomonas_euryale.AAC.15
MHSRSSAAPAGAWHSDRGRAAAVGRLGRRRAQPARLQFTSSAGSHLLLTSVMRPCDRERVSFCRSARACEPRLSIACHLIKAPAPSPVIRRLALPPPPHRPASSASLTSFSRHCVRVRGNAGGARRGKPRRRAGLLPQRPSGPPERLRQQQWPQQHHHHQHHKHQHCRQRQRSQRRRQRRATAQLALRPRSAVAASGVVVLLARVPKRGRPRRLSAGRRFLRRCLEQRAHGRAGRPNRGTAPHVNGALPGDGHPGGRAGA